STGTTGSTAGTSGGTAAAPPPATVTVLDGPAAPLTITSGTAGSPIEVGNAVVNGGTSALAITVDGQTTYRTPASVSSLDAKGPALVIDVNQGSIAAPIPYDGASLSLVHSASASDWTVAGDGTGTVSGGGVASISFKNTTQLAAGGPNDTLHGPAADSTWKIDAPGGGTVAGTSFSGFESLAGAPGNEDTFVLEPSGALAGVADGGPGGYDSLVVDGQRGSIVSNPADAHSGTLVIDGVPFRYAGLEPIDISAANVTFNGADVTGSTEAGDKDLIKVSPGSSGSIQIQDRDPTDTFDLAEVHTFTISGTSSVTINGGHDTDTVRFTGDYNVPNSNLTVNAEHIKVDPGVTIDVGTGNISLNAVYKDNGLSFFGITTTIPVLGVDGLVDISTDKGDWDSGTSYDAGDVVVDPFDGLQYKATGSVSGGLAPHNGGSWTPAGSTSLTGAAINLTAFAGSLSTKAKGGGQTLPGDLIVDSVAGFDDAGSFTLDDAGTPRGCTYTGRDIDSTSHAVFKFQGVTCSGLTNPADGAVITKDIVENGSGAGINHAGLDLEYHANVNVHGATVITATGDVTLASAIDVRATANANGGADTGPWVSGTLYTKGQIVTDGGKRWVATKDITPSNSTDAPSTHHGLLDSWSEAKDHDASVAATFV